MFYVATVVLCTWIYRWQRRRSLVYSMPGTPGKSELRPQEGLQSWNPLCPSLLPYVSGGLCHCSSPLCTFYSFSQGHTLCFACAGDASSSLACPSSFISLPPCCCQGNVCLRAVTAYIQPSQLPSGSNPNVSIDTNTCTHIPNTYTTPM